MEALDLFPRLEEDKEPEFKDGDGGGEGGDGESMVVIRQVDNGYIVDQQDENGVFTYVYVESIDLIDYLKTYYVGI